ncbi:hypothetical protein IEQ34_023009 [Dendrobium chrysotoxum]|uniref:Uncharacterized protein n=1 Tax=Dendrobium chrysotoxum TaxID=161865 RepID=A0AAV7G0I5_DENCH|nr:hypothetical protein IEQ34_023009 [Dendrobium chrysotoxum]
MPVEKFNNDSINASLYNTNFDDAALTLKLSSGLIQQDIKVLQRIKKKDLAPKLENESMLLHSSLLECPIKEILDMHMSRYKKKGKYFQQFLPENTVNVPTIGGATKKPITEAITEQAPKRASVFSRLSIASATAPAVQRKIYDPKLQSVAVIQPVRT